VNAGILTSGYAPPPMPYGLLGRPQPVRMIDPTSIHPEASDWAGRVIANGGSVSLSTLRAVSTFCDGIDRASIRSRFYRLNLFCGTGLSAALVPLYRGQSLGGTQFGNATDTNVNFAAGDYVETGSTGGLKGNGTSKYLDTGFAASALTPSSAHAAAYAETLTADTTADKVLLMAHSQFGGIYGIGSRDGGNLAVNFGYAGTPTSARTDPIPPASSGLLLSSATSTTDLRFFHNGNQTFLQSAARNEAALSTRSVFVFAANANGTPSARTAARLRAYSCGLGMTAAQASAYSTAMQAFQTALTRNV
jgi:hypothetical protein